MTATSIEGQLAPHPLHALYWSVIAPLLYAQIIFLVLITIVPGLAETFSGSTTSDYTVQWRLLTLVQAVVLMRIMRWSAFTTGTPFAGNLDTTSNWLGASALVGPAVLIGSGVLIGSLFGGGDANWAYREDIDRGFFSQSSISLSMIMYVVVVAPLVEEIGFRGIAIGCLIGRGIDPRLAVLITTAGFTALHVQYSPLGLASVFLSGLVLGWLRIASGSMSAPIVAHMSANAVSVWFLAAS
ncbi:MAG: type II CAAX endopeptidase family protein [Pseudomonadota bacterium]